MSLKLYKELLQELRAEGIKVEQLTLMQIAGSIKLHKLLNRGNLKC